MTVATGRSVALVAALMLIIVVSGVAQELHPLGLIKETERPDWVLPSPIVVNQATELDEFVDNSSGLPPVGRVVRIEERPSVVLAVVGRPLRTSDVLADEGMLSRINEHGSRMMGMLSSSPSLETLMRLSRTFATDTGLASEEVLRAMDAVEPPGMASMSMLGNSVFAVGANEPSTDSLRALGEVFVCDTDVIGPRLL